MVSNYADIIVMRHYLEGAARYASEVTQFPLSMLETEPTSTPLKRCSDLYSIYKTQALGDLNIYTCGD